MKTIKKLENQDKNCTVYYSMTKRVYWVSTPDADSEMFSTLNEAMDWADHYLYGTPVDGTHSVVDSGAIQAVAANPVDNE